VTRARKTDVATRPEPSYLGDLILALITPNTVPFLPVSFSDERRKKAAEIVSGLSGKNYLP
jgi:hypothetical protein